MSVFANFVIWYSNPFVVTHFNINVSNLRDSFVRTGIKTTSLKGRFAPFSSYYAGHIQLSKLLSFIKSVLIVFVVYEIRNSFYNLKYFNPLNAELNPICHLLALLGGATIVVVSKLRVKVPKKCLYFINNTLSRFIYCLRFFHIIFVNTSKVLGTHVAMNSNVSDQIIESD